MRTLGAPLLQALEAKMPGARTRAEIAATLARALAEKVGAEEPAMVAEAARLCEVGKLYAEPELRWIPLGDADQAVRQKLDAYIEHGRALAFGAGVPGRACAWILNSRERWDGAGPTGLLGADIPLGSRLIAVCREYLDAPQAAAAVPDEDPRLQAGRRLEALAGTVLDPALATAAIALTAPAPGLTVDQGGEGDDGQALADLIAASGNRRRPDGADLLIAREGDRVVGALAYRDAGGDGGGGAGDGGAAVEIVGLWVREVRAGIGSALLAALRERAGAHRRATLIAVVGSDELAALGFLQARGFRPRALRPGAGAGSDELELGLEL